MNLPVSFRSGGDLCKRENVSCGDLLSCRQFSNRRYELVDLDDRRTTCHFCQKLPQIPFVREKFIRVSAQPTAITGDEGDFHHSYVET